MKPWRIYLVDGINPKLIGSHYTRGEAEKQFEWLKRRVAAHFILVFQTY
ncbi:hypothetical protein HC928_11005 [bacterium]|nr:hypothetical protein [bacterium]